MAFSMNFSQMYSVCLIHAHMPPLFSLTPLSFMFPSIHSSTYMPYVIFIYKYPFWFCWWIDWDRVLLRLWLFLVLDVGFCMFAVWNYGSYVALIKFWDGIMFKIIKVFLGTVPGLGSPTNLIYLTVISWHTCITLTIVRSIILLWKLLLKKESLKLGKIINLLFYRKKLLEPDQLKVSFKVLELTRESGREGGLSDCFKQQILKIFLGNQHQMRLSYELAEGRISHLK